MNFEIYFPRNHFRLWDSDSVVELEVPSSTSRISSAVIRAPGSSLAVRTYVMGQWFGFYERFIAQFFSSAISSARVQDTQPAIIVLKPIWFWPIAIPSPMFSFASRVEFVSARSGC